MNQQQQPTSPHTTTKRQHWWTTSRQTGVVLIPSHQQPTNNINIRSNWNLYYFYWTIQQYQVFSCCFFSDPVTPFLFLLCWLLVHSNVHIFGHTRLTFHTYIDYIMCCRSPALMYDTHLRRYLSLLHHTAACCACGTWLYDRERTTPVVVCATSEYQVFNGSLFAFAGGSVIQQSHLREVPTYTSQGQVRIGVSCCYTAVYLQVNLHQPHFSAVGRGRTAAM